MTLKKDLTNQKFGKLTAKHVHSKSRNGHIRWYCDCDCGRTHIVMSTHLLSNKITHCGCVPSLRGPRHPQWEGCGEISGQVFRSIYRQALQSKNRSKIEFDVSIEYLWDLFLKQNKKCSL